MDILKTLERIRSKRQSRMDDDGWVTINGTHVYIENGYIAKGPKALKEYKSSNNSSPGKHEIKVKGGKLRYTVEPDAIYIHGIEVDSGERKQGIGTKLLNKVIDISDSSKKPIELFAVPIRGSDMTEDQLIDWYEKRGFKQFMGTEMKYVPGDKEVTDDFDPFVDPETGEFDPFRVIMWEAEHGEQKQAVVQKKPEKKERAQPKSKLPEIQIEAAKRVEAESLKRSTEQMTILDAKGNVVVQADGNANGVEFPPGYIHKMENRVVTHNHPQEFGGTFSINDLVTFFASNCKAMRAVGKEGTYHLERGEAEYKQVYQFDKEARNAVNLAMMELSSCKKLLESDVKDGLISKTDAQKRQEGYRKDILTDLSKKYGEIADKHGLIYIFTPNA